MSEKSATGKSGPTAKRGTAAKPAAPSKQRPARKPQAESAAGARAQHTKTSSEKTPAQPAIASVPSYGVWPD